MSTTAATVQVAPAKATKTPRGRKPANRKAKGKRTLKVASQPSRCRTALHQGIYISPPRIKYCLDGAGINRAIEDAINELRDAEPHEVELVDAKSGKKTGKNQVTALVPWDKISEATKVQVKRARAQNEEHKKELAKREDAKATKLAEDIKAGRVDPKKLEEERKAAEAEAVKAAKERAQKDAERKAKGHPVRGPKKVTPYGEEVELLSKMRIRFAKEAATQVAASFCAALHELMEFGMGNALKQGRKIFKRRHALQPGVESLELGCLYRNLDAFKTAQAEEAARVVEDAKRKEEKKQKKKDEAQAAADGAAAPAPVAEPDLEDDSDEDPSEEDSGNFGHYVKQVCHNIMNQKLDGWKPSKPNEKHPYEDIRVSLEIREFGSLLITDFTKRMCPLLKSQITANGVKTVSPEVTRQVINFMFEYAGVNHEEVNQRIDAKLAEYAKWMEKKKLDKKAAAAAKEAAEKAKKEAAAADGAAPAADAPAASAEEDSSDHDESDHDDDEDQSEDDEQ